MSTAAATELNVVMYHYVRDLPRTRYPAIKGLPLGEFRRQVALFGERYTPVTMEHVCAALRGDSDLPRDAALLTFDDGYLEHFTTCFPILHDAGIQGCFFPPVGPARDRVLLDVNRVHFVLASAEADALGARIDAAVRERGPELGLATVEELRNEWARPNRFDDAETIYVKRMLQVALPEDMRGELARELFAEHVGVDESTFATELYCGVDQLRCMVACGMYVGSHGTTHRWLDSLPPAEQAADIDESLAFLRDLRSPVDDHWALAYPYGAHDPGVVEHLRGIGCAAAFTTRVAAARIGEDDPLLLPRYDTNDFR